MSKQISPTNIIGVKELRQNMDKYAKAVQKGRSFTVVKRSKPIFTIQKPQELDEWGDPADEWKDSVDLRDENGDGMPVEEFLSLLQKVTKEDKERERQNSKVSG